MKTNTSNQQELTLKDQPTLIRIRQAAKELWPLVKHEKRSSGAPCFKSLDSLGAQLNTAFRKNLIPGQREKKRVIWLDKDAATNWVCRYCELAKSSKGMTVSRRHMKPRVSKPRTNGDAIKEPLPSNKAYILTDQKGKVVVVQATSDSEAIASALKLAKIGLHRIDGSEMINLLR
jgi:hypothetical protein